jgi:hypothetical protein
MQAETALRRSFKSLPACKTRGIIKNNQRVFVAVIDCRYGQTTKFNSEMLIEAVVIDLLRQMLIMLATAGLAE